LNQLLAELEMPDFTAAIERIVAGLEKRSRILDPRERRIVAVHETGHALVSAALVGSDPVHKISIIPRGIGALGYTMQRPTEDRYLMTKEELEDKIAVLLGGRAAEEVAIVEQALQTSKASLTRNRAVLDEMSACLLDKESLDEAELRPFVAKVVRGVSSSAA
jgi:ATP-dependent Zn protease